MSRAPRHLETPPLHLPSPPLPAPKPDGSPCAGGSCQAGVCTQPAPPEIVADENDLVIKTNANADVIFAMGTSKANGITVRNMVSRLDTVSTAVDTHATEEEEARSDLQSSLTTSINQLSSTTGGRLDALENSVDTLEGTAEAHATRLEDIETPAGQLSNTVQQQSGQIASLGSEQTDLQTQLTSLEVLVGDKVDLDAHNIHITVTDALGDLLGEVQDTVADQKDAIDAAGAMADANSNLLSSALSCAKAGHVWDPDASPAKCVQPRVRVGAEDVECTEDVKGALRLSDSSGNLEVCFEIRRTEEANWVQMSKDCESHTHREQWPAWPSDLVHIPILQPFPSSAMAWPGLARTLTAALDRAPRAQPRAATPSLKRGATRAMASTGSPFRARPHSRSAPCI